MDAMQTLCPNNVSLGFNNFTECVNVVFEEEKKETPSKEILVHMMYSVYVSAAVCNMFEIHRTDSSDK